MAALDRGWVGMLVKCTRSTLLARPTAVSPFDIVKRRCAWASLAGTLVPSSLDAAVAFTPREITLKAIRAEIAVAAELVPEPSIVGWVKIVLELRDWTCDVALVHADAGCCSWADRVGKRCVKLATSQINEHVWWHTAAVVLGARLGAAGLGWGDSIEGL